MPDVPQSWLEPWQNAANDILTRMEQIMSQLDDFQAAQNRANAANTAEHEAIINQIRQVADGLVNGQAVADAAQSLNDLAARMEQDTAAMDADDTTPVAPVPPQPNAPTA